MTETLKIRDPRLEATHASRTAFPTLSSLAGKTMVILNNGWTCMDEIANFLSDALKQRYGVAKVVSFPVPVGVAADESVIRDAAGMGDFCAVGLAN